MSLKQKSASPKPSEIPHGEGLAADSRSGSRRVGGLLAVVGTLFVLLAAGDALAGTTLGSSRDDVMRGSDHRKAEESFAGMGGADLIHGGAGADSLSGGAGDDEIYGLGGQDFLLGGSGDDFMEAADGERDHIGCGPGNDVVSVDKKDLVARDCETVYTS